MEITERYNYVFDQYDGDSFIYDLKEDKRIEDLSECADILNKKEKEIERWFEHKKFDAQVNMDCLDKIEELETRLSNCIEPKFKQGQKCYFRWGNDISSVKVKDIIKLQYIIEEPSGYNSVVSEDQLFATEEEAKAKLEEVMNE